MAGHTSWKELRAEIERDPVRQARHEREMRKLRRYYNRPWWKAVRAFERLREHLRRQPTT